MAANDDINAVVTTGGLPGGPHDAPTPGKTFDLAISATQEYVAGQRLQWYVTMARAESWSLDDVTADFGVDVYSRMLLDPQVRSVINVLKAAILEDGINVMPAVIDDTDPDFDRATQMADDVEQMFDSLNPSLDDTLWDMLDAVAVGNRVAEQIYTLDTTSSGKKQYSLTSLPPRPLESVAFVVDPYYNVLGILARIPGQPFGVQQGMLLSDPDVAKNFLPLGKFAVLTHAPKNRDPRGTSILRPAFGPWNEKMQMRREYLKYLTQFAIPSLIGITAPMAQAVPQYNRDGTPKFNDDGSLKTTVPEATMAAALQGLQNGTVVAIPNGSDVKIIQPNGAGEAFQNAFNYWDRQIVKAVINQTLATEESQYQTRAATGTHKDVFDSLIRQKKRPVTRMLKSVLRVWAMLNGYPKHLLPDLSLGTSEAEDIPQLWTAAAGLMSSGYLDDSQLPALDEMLRLAKREPIAREPAPAVPSAPEQPTPLVQPNQPEPASPAANPGG